MKLDEAGTFYLVAPYAGAWIETNAEARVQKLKAGRSLRGSVD